MSQPDQGPPPVNPPTGPGPTTEKQAARKLAATRKNRINYLWEATQATLALLLTVATIYTCIRISPVVDANGNVNFAPVPETLKNALFVVLGFYFGRTNHTRPVTGTDDVEQTHPEA